MLAHLPLIAAVVDACVAPSHAVDVDRWSDLSMPDPAVNPLMTYSHPRVSESGVG